MSHLQRHFFLPPRSCGGGLLWAPGRARGGQHVVIVASLDSAVPGAVCKVLGAEAILRVSLLVGAPWTVLPREVSVPSSSLVLGPAAKSGQGSFP